MVECMLAAKAKIRLLTGAQATRCAAKVIGIRGRIGKLCAYWERGGYSNHRRQRRDANKTGWQHHVGWR